jgi:hypothetical protein
MWTERKGKGSWDESESSELGVHGRGEKRTVEGKKQ